LSRQPTTEPIVVSLTPWEVLGPVHEGMRSELGSHLLVTPRRSLSEVLEAVGDADYIVGDWLHELSLDADLLNRAERCLVVFQPTAGTDGIDLDHAATLGIPVANAPGTNDRTVAEWTVMAILAMLRDVWRHHAGVLAGKWEMLEAAQTGVYELGDRTVGILGMGRIGQAVAARLAPFELQRLAYADVAAAPPELERRLGLERLELDELCAISDALTIHVPLLPATTGLLDARRIALLPPHAVIVNAARGAVIDEVALCVALDAGRLHGAALDVFAEEPPPLGHPLRGRPNVLLSPHLAGSTNEARVRMVASALRNLDQVLRGGDPGHVVNAVEGVPRR
jgi:phosphoglycerate dehydrogenase-like enzyme